MVEPEISQVAGSVIFSFDWDVREAVDTDKLFEDGYECFSLNLLGRISREGKE
jgi:hypothetical protein